MSLPFYVNARNFQALENLEELRLAFSERVFAATGKFRKYVWEFGEYITVDGITSWVAGTEDDGIGRYAWVDGDGTENDTLQNTVPEFIENLGEPNERRTKIGHNLQAFTFFRGIQEFIVSGGGVVGARVYNNGFVWDPDAILYSEKFAAPDAETDPVFKTPETFFQYIGDGLFKTEATPDDPFGYGFRRAVDVYSSAHEKKGQPILERCTLEYFPNPPKWVVSGLCQAGDILGHWIVEDLISCLKKITAIKIFYKINDDGTRFGLHNCGAFITCPAWYSKQSLYSTTVTGYKVVNSSTCTQTMSVEEYRAQSPLPGDWRLFRTGSFVAFGEVFYWVHDEPAAYHYVNVDTATQEYGWPEPWETMVREDMARPPSEKVIPPGEWVRVSLHETEPVVIEEFGSGYPAVNPMDAVLGGSNDTVFKWCSYVGNETIPTLTFPEGSTAPIVPTVDNVDLFTEVLIGLWAEDPVPDRGVLFISRHIIGETITLYADRPQSQSLPTFIANWNFTNAGSNSA